MKSRLPFSLTIFFYEQMIEDEKSKRLPIALTIAGSDSGAGAGIQADLLTFADFHVFGTSAITALTAQNPDKVQHIQTTSPQNLKAQIQQVLDYFPVVAIKTGMLPTAELVEVVVSALSELAPNVPLVVDPVLVATSGNTLVDNQAFAAIKEKLLPQATLVTPNLDEVEALLETRPGNPEEIKQSAKKLAHTSNSAFLVKGGHLKGNELVDVLAEPDGKTRVFTAKRISDVNTHGSGCTLSAAITANLAQCYLLPQAVERAWSYLQQSLQAPLEISGNRFIRHGGNKP
jgi:hydroxymethylpyrimidine/phosphomethylpyrimidine kinase